MALQVLVPPAAEPVTLSEAKAHLRVDISTDDSLISALISAARDLVERTTRRALIYTGYRWTLDVFPEGYLELPRQPVVEAAAATVFAYGTPRVQYYDMDGVLQALVKEDDFEHDLASNPPQLVLPPLVYWPFTEVGKVNAVRVDFVAGYGATGSSVPALLRQAILLLVSHWYEHREAVGTVGAEVPMAVDSILKIYSAGDYL